MGKTITLTISRTITDAPPVLKQVRGYGDPVMIELMGLDTNLFGVGNFQNVCLYDPNNAGFGAVTNYQNMDTAALGYLRQIQPNDFDVNRKLNWLGVPDSLSGRPYMAKNGVCSWGLMVFGYNTIQVESVNGVPVVHQFKARYQSRKDAEIIDMYKLVMFRRSDMARPVSELIAAGLVHHATEAFYPSNKLGEAPRGVILNPVWSPRDWATNTGYSDELYIPKAFCF